MLPFANATTTPSTAISNQTVVSQAAAAAEPVLTSDFETFLKMLTVQAKYQDPLEPIDSSEYASQLAQFSMVEQQVKANDLLTLLSGHLGDGNMASMGGWIGMEVRTDAPSQFDGSPITLSPNPPAAADEIYLIVEDINGVEVQRTAIGNSSESIEWAGVADDGSPFDSGLYTFSLEARAEGSLLSINRMETYSRITEVRSEAGETVLVLNGGSVVTPAQVTALREDA